MKFGQGLHHRFQFPWRWVEMIIRFSRHPWREFPKVAVREQKRVPMRTFYGNRNQLKSLACYVVEYIMYPSQRFGRRMVGRPSPQAEHSSHGLQLPEQRTAESAGIAQKLTCHRLAVVWICGKNRGEHGTGFRERVGEQSLTSILDVAL